MVGTKSDLRGVVDQRDNPDNKEITREEGENMAMEIKAKCYMETSSKTGEGVKEVFHEALKVAMLEGKTDPGCCIII